MFCSTLAVSTGRLAAAASELHILLSSAIAKISVIQRLNVGIVSPRRYIREDAPSQDLCPAPQH